MYARKVFNIVGEKNIVDKAALEIKKTIADLFNYDSEIIIANKESINKTMRWNIYETKQTSCYINKVYMNDKEASDISFANDVVELSRHIRNSNRGTVHPHVLHVDDTNNIYVSEFMKKCSQVNCVYPIQATNKVKSDCIGLFFT